MGADMSFDPTQQAEFYVDQILRQLEAMPQFSKQTMQVRFRYPDVPDTVVPCILLKGTAAAPVMWVQAVMHGDEYDGALACLRIRDTLPLRELSGSVILFPLVNPSAFYAYQHGSPYDGNVNLNRVFGENDNHSYTWEYGRFWFVLVRRIANFVIDFHGASKLNTICHFAGTTDMGFVSDEIALRIARKTGVEYIMIDSNTQPGNTGRLDVSLAKYNIPCIVFENGEGLSCKEEAIQRHVCSAMQVLFEAGFLAHGESLPCSGELFEGDEYIYFDIDGLLLDHVPLGTAAKKGDVLLRVLNTETLEVQEVICCKDGCFVYCIHHAAVVKKGDIAYTLARKTDGLKRTTG